MSGDTHSYGTASKLSVYTLSALPDKQYYVLNSSLNELFEFKVGHLTNSKVLQKLYGDNTWYYVKIFVETTSGLYSLQSKTEMRPFDDCSWNEWLTLSLRYKDLEFSDKVIIQLYGLNDQSVSPIFIGDQKISIFSINELRSGDFELPLYLQNDELKDCNDTFYRETFQEMQAVIKYKSDQVINTPDWLNCYTMNKFDQLRKEMDEKWNYVGIVVGFPSVLFGVESIPVVYHNKDLDSSTLEILDILPFRVIVDNELHQENIVEIKHHILTRSLSKGFEGKPNASVVRRLKEISEYSLSRKLTPEDCDIIWKYRNYLTSNRRMLFKFLKVVDWNIKEEADEAMETLNRWSPLRPEEALELLVPSAFAHRVVCYSIRCVLFASSKVLANLLIQLVQSIHYFEINDYNDTPNLMGAALFPVFNERRERIYSVSETDVPWNTGDIDIIQAKGLLTKFLIMRCSSEDCLAVSLYWNLYVLACANNAKSAVYQSVLNAFMDYLKVLQPEDHSRWHVIDKQVKLVKLLQEGCKVISNVGPRRKMIDKLRSYLGSTDFALPSDVTSPINPVDTIRYINAENCSIFNSKTLPLKLVFNVTGREDLILIYKNNDDVRQDHFITKLFTFINDILLKENLDLKLTPYNVVPTGSNQGFIEYVDSRAIADVLASFGSIQNYFRKVAASDYDSYGIRAEVMDNYIKSCAGYSVLSYVFGIGDRHLDNIMLKSNGVLFHIDFGFILGRDPKPFPPPMKLSREMIEAMGGQNSEHYQQFKNACFNIFLLLRRNSGIIMNMFALMLDSGINDISLDPDKILNKVEEKFKLEMDDESAIIYLLNLIDESVKAVFATVVEQIHKLAQYWRK